MKQGILFVAALSLVAPASMWAQQLVVTAEGEHGRAPGEVMRDDVSVEIHGKPGRIENWTHLVGQGTELYFAIDDGEDTDLGTQFSSLRTFILGQPPTTKIGLAYLRNGSAMIVAPLTDNHQQVAQALRLPMGQPGIAASPYMGISDLVKKWQGSALRREVVLISNGVDPYSQPPDIQNPYLDVAISDAQRAGVLVHSMYFPGEGHMGHSYSRIYWGQNYLSQLGDATGGEAYWQGPTTPVSFEPYLRDLAQRLQNQYLLLVDKGDTKDGLQDIRVRDTKSGVSLVSASRIYFGQNR